METGTLKDKIPPHNNEAETATLGALLQDPEAMTRVITYLRPDDFYKNSHKKIFSAMLDLDTRSEAIDLITITDELKKNGELDSCGGAAYVSRLTSSVPTSANIEYYAKIVQETSLRRSLERISQGIIAQAHDDSQNVRDIIEQAETKIFDLTNKQFTGNYSGTKEIVSQTVEAIERLYHTKDNYTGVPTGFKPLDELTGGFQNSEFIVIGARPSMGKTALALSMAANITLRYKLAAGFFTLEMNKMALMQRMLTSEARINAIKIRTGLLRPSDFHNLTEAAARIYEAQLFIEDSPGLKLLDLRALARRMVSREKVAIIFIDYLTLITSENKDLPRHEQIAEISRSLKALARELKIPIVVLSQVRRDAEGKQPNMADLRESGSIEQDADVVMFIHRDRKTDQSTEDAPNISPTELIVAKQRNGPVGTIDLVFIPQYTRFELKAQDMQ
ncbi:MAG: replicative DNA helicase [Spirochaetales bacterium]|nr:replicative DNA helicase [Spirochaetales bacterium]